MWVITCLTLNNIVMPEVFTQFLGIGGGLAGFAILLNLIVRAINWVGEIFFYTER